MRSGSGEKTERGAGAPPRAGPASVTRPQPAPAPPASAPPPTPQTDTPSEPALAHATGDKEHRKKEHKEHKHKKEKKEKKDKKDKKDKKEREEGVVRSDKVEGEGSGEHKKHKKSKKHKEKDRERSKEREVRSTTPCYSSPHNMISDGTIQGVPWPVMLML